MSSILIRGILWASNHGQCLRFGRYTRAENISWREAQYYVMFFDKAKRMIVDMSGANGCVNSDLGSASLCYI